MLAGDDVRSIPARAGETSIALIRVNSLGLERSIPARAGETEHIHFGIYESM